MSVGYKTEVEWALGELERAFPGHPVEAKPDGDGGAYVTMRGFELGPVYAQDSTWVKFQISFQYPNADVYPHFVVPGLQRADGQALGQGFQQKSFPGDGQPATQLSRRSKNRSAEFDTAAVKLLKVLDWLRSR